MKWEYKEYSYNNINKLLLSRNILNSSNIISVYNDVVANINELILLKEQNNAIIKIGMNIPKTTGKRAKFFKSNVIINTNKLNHYILELECLLDYIECVSESEPLTDEELSAELKDFEDFF